MPPDELGQLVEIAESGWNDSGYAGFGGGSRAEFA
jgi:hypothetical protein